MNLHALGYTLLFAPLCLTSATAHHPADLDLPPIGTIAYSQGCTVTHAWEDGSAIAECPEDGVMYAYDADGNNPPASVGYTGPRWDAGWYVVTDDNPYTVDHTHNVTG